MVASAARDLSIGYFADSSGQYSLPDLLKNPALFQPLDHRVWQWNIHTHWYKLPITNTTDTATNWVLSCGVANPPLLRAFWVNDAGATRQLYPENTGATATHYARYTNVSIPVELAAGERGTLFIEYRSFANFPLSLRLVDEELFLERSYRFTLFNGISLGVGIVLLLFFVVQFALRPSKALGFYCLFVFCILLFMVQIFGYGWRFIFPQQAEFSMHITALAAAFIYVFYFLFIAHFFSFRQRNPLFYRTLIGVSGAIGALALVGLLRSTDFALALLVVMGLPLSVIGAAKAVQRAEPGARLFLLGSCLHCSFTYLLLVVCLGVDLGYNAFALATSGQFIDVLCLSAAILLQQRHLHKMLNQQMLERERDMAVLAASEQAAAQLRHQSKTVVLQSATASHDLLQLLAAMRLQMATQNAADPIIRQLLDTLHHADAMLRNRLQLNRATYRELQETVSGKTLLEEIASAHRLAYKAKGLRLDLVAADAEVRCLRLLVRRILDNLLGNALRHTPKGRVLLAGRRRKTGYLIQVRDTGPGMPEERLRELNKPFSGGELREGYGLGLYIVQALCQEAGYRFSIDSRPRRGTCCSLWIPREPVDQ